MLFDDAQRIVIKVGSALIADKETSELEQKKLREIVNDAISLRNKRKDNIIVSSGSVRLGKKLIQKDPTTTNLKLEEKHWPVMKPFLVFLKYITNEQYTGITMDPNIIEVLRKI